MAGAGVGIEDAGGSIGASGARAMAPIGMGSATAGAGVGGSSNGVAGISQQKFIRRVDALFVKKSESVNRRR